MTIQALIQQLFVGIASGLVLYLSASGMSLIMSGLAVINFGQGSFYVAGLYFTWWVANRFNFWPALILVPIGVGLVGGIVELLLRPLYGKNMLYQLLVTMGFSYILSDSMVLIFGRTTRMVKPPFKITLSLAGIDFSGYYLLIICVALLVAILFWIMFAKTKLGMMFRAIISNREMVGNLGVNVKLLFSIMFMIGVCLAGLSGVLQAPIQSIGITAGSAVLNSVMIILIIGGLTSMKGAFVASLLVGVVNAIGAVFFPSFYSLIPVTIMLIVLMFKPNGLFAAKGV